MLDCVERNRLFEELKGKLFYSNIVTGTVGIGIVLVLFTID